MKARCLATALIAAAVVALPTASASATTFCVPTYSAGCPNNGTNVPQASIDTAVSANGTDGQADTVILPADYTATSSGTITASGTDALQIIGQGKTTVLTSTSSINAYVLNMAGRPNVDVSHLKIVIPASMPTNGGAGFYASTQADIVDVDVESANDGGTGATLVGGTTWTGGHVFGNGGTFTYGIATNGTPAGTATVVGVQVEDSNSSDIRLAYKQTPFVLRQSGLGSPGQAAVSLTQGATATIENTVIETANAGAVSLSADTSDSVLANLDHVTIVDTNATPGAAALSASVVNSPSNGSATINMNNSIVRGYDQYYYRFAPVSGAIGNAHINASYSNVEGAHDNDLGDGSYDQGAGMTSADPLFAGPADYRLLAGSPSIDAGNPAPGLTTDFLGLSRPVDGDGNGSAIRDQGAYEYRPAAAAGGGGGGAVDITSPVVSKAKFGKVTFKKGGALKLTLSEAANITLKLKGKKKTTTISASGKAGANTITIKRKKLKPGSYKATVSAVDAAGNVSLTKTLKIKVKR